MSDGKTHTVATIGVTLGLTSGFALSYFTNDPVLQSVVVGGCISGILLSPDLDVDNGNISDYHIKKILRLDVLWGVLWRAYRLAFKHRGFLSHSPIISTILRVLYLFIPMFVVVLKDQDTDWLTIGLWAIIAQILALPLIYLLITFPDYFWHYGPYFVVGMALSDITHLLFDYV